MERCYVCKKFIWPWQKRWLGGGTHATCDRKKFKKSCEELHELHQGRFNKHWVEDQVAKREKHYY